MGAITERTYYNFSQSVYNAKGLDDIVKKVEIVNRKRFVVKEKESGIQAKV
ncbi:hypothetical protein JOD45_000254 [Scopulibacillus daqui]|uniref:Uncharacterized protein n=1 Tax=Scopulibacillus daqui TaxID=1469162 RepID=A0ABS2PVS3_9BACL|nr:hypothetical protein [Scopulibacillus daqui]MBM7644063.1 hypothetical protein [Scopulibacillus daqui]